MSAMWRKTFLRYRREVVLFCHLLLAGAAYTAAFLLRFDGWIPPDQQRAWLYTLPFAVLAKGVAIYYFRLTQGLWRYVGMDDLVRIAKATVASSVALVVGVVIFFYGQGFPRAVFVIDFLITFTLLGGVRFSIRLFREAFRPMAGDAPGKRTLIVGAGDSGELALRALQRDFRGALTPVGFLDDDPVKRGRTIHGYPIAGTVAEAPRVVKEMEIADIVIAIPGASKHFVRNVVESCSAHNVNFHIMPAFRDMITGELETEHIRDVRVEDLLGRDPIELDRAAVSNDLKGKCVLVTGAGGSIGSELARQIATYQPAKLVLFDMAETPLFRIEQELHDLVPDVERVVFLGDIKHAGSVDMIFEKVKPDRVYHAAAYKHVPLMESHPVEAVLNNVFGTRNLAEAAIRHGVERFVMISTDKAVRPTSTMGATKRCAELLVSRLNGGETKFVAVRFGNVLGSNGSVVPIFRRQIERGGPVTVTHPEITRFFMTIPEAVELVLQASTVGVGGEVFVLDMGEPIKIVDLARNMIELSGLEVGRDIQIEFTGLRPGEKLYEELVASGEDMKVTPIPKVMVLMTKNKDQHRDDGFMKKMESLEAFAQSRDGAATAEILWGIITRYDPDVAG